MSFLFNGIGQRQARKEHLLSLCFLSFENNTLHRVVFESQIELLFRSHSAHSLLLLYIRTRCEKANHSVMPSANSVAVIRSHIIEMQKITENHHPTGTKLKQSPNAFGKTLHSEKRSDPHNRLNNNELQKAFECNTRRRGMKTKKTKLENCGSNITSAEINVGSDIK